MIRSLSAIRSGVALLLRTPYSYCSPRLITQCTIIIPPWYTSYSNIDTAHGLLRALPAPTPNWHDTSYRTTCQPPRSAVASLTDKVHTRNKLPPPVLYLDISAAARRRCDTAIVHSVDKLTKGGRSDVIARKVRRIGREMSLRNFQCIRESFLGRPVHIEHRLSKALPRINSNQTD